MPEDIAKPSRLPNSSRMLLADESGEAYDTLLTEYVEDLSPVGALERRQVELILRCDLDIDRQFRMIAQHLNPLGEEASQGAEMMREWHRRELMHPSTLNNLDEEEGEVLPAAPLTLPEGDERLTPLIAQRYAQRRELMEIHQREVASSERRRRQAIELLFKIQDRRNREAILDAEVAEVVEALGDRGQGQNA